MHRSIAGWAAALALAGAAGSALAAPRTVPAGACINMGNHLEAPSETAWGRAIAEDDFAIIAKAGFATVRLPVRWSAHAAQAAPYAIDPAFMARVRHVVALARAAGLNVIVNDHNYDELMIHPAENADRLAGLWRQIAAAFADQPRDHVWFEIENEPHANLTNANLMATLSPALAAIRATNPDRPVIIGGENWSGIDSLATLNLPDDPQVIPTVHYYLPMEFTHQGAEWVKPVHPLGRNYGGVNDQALLARDVEKVAAYVRRTGLAPLLGEFGSIDKAPLDQRVAWQKTIHTAFAAQGVGTCAWAYANTFPLYDSKARAWLPGMLDAMGLPGAPLAPPASAAADPLQALRAQLPGKLINDPTTIGWDVYGAGAAAKPVRGGDIPGGAALQVTVPAKGANVFDVGLNIPLTQGFTKGTPYVISFRARTLSADTPDGNGTIALRFQQNAAPYPGFGDAVRTIGKSWQLYEVTGVADRAVPAGLAVVGMQLAGARQVIQIGQVVVQEGATSLIRQTAPAPAARCPSATPVVPASLAGKGDLLTDPDTLNWDVFGSGETHTRITSCGIPGDSAYRFAIAAAGTNPYDIVASIPIKGAIKAGDTLMVALVGRAVSDGTADGKGLVTIRIQQNAVPYPGFGDRTLSLGSAWQVSRFTVDADRDIPDGQGTLTLQLAGAAQTIDLGRAYAVKLPPEKP